MFMSLSTVPNNNRACSSDKSDRGAYENRGACKNGVLIRMGALIGIEALIDKEYIRRGTLIRKRSLIGRRALNGIITVTELFPTEHLRDLVYDTPQWLLQN